MRSLDLTPRERFERACRREPVDRVPFWYMRQAGRYMEEYGRAKEGRTFLETCKDPELCRDLALQPIEAFGIEVAIVFSDILLPCEAMGQTLVYGDGGPELCEPIRDRAAVEALRDFEAAVATPWPARALRLTVEALGPDRPVIGFCGAPFTLASYMVEGRGSRQYENIKRLLFGEPDTLLLLLERVTANLRGYLDDQIDAGAAAIQIFDSWAGCLGPEEYARFAHPFTSALVRHVKERGVPVISYVNGCDHVLALMADSGADVCSIDWRVAPARARQLVGGSCALQGNLDPAALLADPATAVEQVRRNLAAFGDAPGHVFNLGSGILRWTPRECVAAATRELLEGAAARRG